MTEESIPELLARFEREHRNCSCWGENCGVSKHPKADWNSHCPRCFVTYPCGTARLVGHIRSLEAAIRKLEAAKETNEGIEFGFKYVPVEDAYYDLLDILGEAQ